MRHRESADRAEASTIMSIVTLPQERTIFGVAKKIHASAMRRVSDAVKYRETPLESANIANTTGSNMAKAGAETEGPPLISRTDKSFYCLIFFRAYAFHEHEIFRSCKSSV